ncbi:hypothetical protein [Microcoleus sp. Pol7_A1]|uniref:hypothetical protein n=1 Tax=Microcoleus sp. Pol7_A1 TaxID=2818893 RepID=UPI002FD1E0FC
MANSKGYNVSEYQPVAVQLSLPWGEEKIYYDSPPSRTKIRSQRRREVKKQDSQKVVIFLNKKSH